MEKLIEKLFEKTPRCLSGLNSSVANAQLPHRWNAGPLFTTRALACVSGNVELDLYSRQQKIIIGFFKKKALTEYYPPLKTLCGKSNNSTVIFNPEIHGWDGETSEVPDKSDEVELMRYPHGAGKVYVNYSYQGVDNYQDLVDEGVENPEDFFDTFTVLIETPETGKLVEVFSRQA